MAGTAQAPTFDQVALKPTGAAGQAPVNRDRVISGIRFGWALEELVWRLSQMSIGAPAGGAGQVSSDYPPDLNHERSAAEHVRELRGLLAADGRVLLGAAPMPQSGVDAGTDVDNMLKAYEAGLDVSSFVLPTSTTRIGRHMRLLDADIVDLIVGEPPEIVTAYELGKALSRTSSQISAAPAATDTTDPVQDAWFASLNKDRLEILRRHLTTLAGALDAPTVVSISASLSYWRRSYYNGLFLAPAGQMQAGQKPQFPGKDQPDRRAALFSALAQQLDIYYDLLTERRQLSSFPVTAVASNLLHKYAQNQWSQWQPFAVRLAVIVVAVGVLAGVGYYLLGATTGSAGLAGGLTTLVGFLAARGAGLLDQGKQTGQAIETRASQALATSQTAAPPITFEGLGYAMLGQVMAQIRLEENKLAISQPLINLVMAGQLTKGPDEVTRAFLQRVMENDEDTNLERLQNMLQGLYTTYQPALPGGGL